MKVKQTHEFTLDIDVIRDDENVYLVLREIDSDGGEFHYPRDVREGSGFDGLEGDAEVLDVIDARTCDGATDEQIVAFYFGDA